MELKRLGYKKCINQHSRNQKGNSCSAERFPILYGYIEKKKKLYNNGIMKLITDTYKEKISGVLGCLDRVVIKGTLQGISYDEGMAFFLRSKKIPIFGYVKFAETLRDKTIQNAENLAKSQGIKIISINRRGDDKKDIVNSVLKEKKNETKGEVNGLFCIISAVEWVRLL